MVGASDVDGVVEVDGAAVSTGAVEVCDEALAESGGGTGLVLALILIKDGKTAEEAIALIRENRGENALFNNDFHAWLLKEGESFFSPSSQQAA